MDSQNNTYRQIFQDIGEKLSNKIRRRFVGNTYGLVSFHLQRSIASEKIYEPTYASINDIRRKLMKKNKGYDF